MSFIKWNFEGLVKKIKYKINYIFVDFKYFFKIIIYRGTVVKMVEILSAMNFFQNYTLHSLYILFIIWGARAQEVEDGIWLCIATFMCSACACTHYAVFKKVNEETHPFARLWLWLPPAFKIEHIHTASPWLLGWLGPEKVPDNEIKILVIKANLFRIFYESRYCKDHGNQGPDNQGPPVYVVWNYHKFDHEIYCA